MLRPVASPTNSGSSRTWRSARPEGAAPAAAAGQLRPPRRTRTRPAAPHATPYAGAAASQAAAPSRAVIVLPGLGNNAADYAGLGAQLAGRGLHVEVAQVARLDWARNAAGLRDPAYWRGTLQPRPTVDWFLQRVQAAVEAARSATGGAPTTLLCHSAGGWLGRLFLLDFERTCIDQYVSLGSPQTPPPEGVVDQTRGILTWCAEACPGGLHSEVQYVSIAGKFIQGAELGGPGTWQQRIVGQGYKQVCGEAAVWGDGVVPLPSAHLPGAQLQLTLDGVYHSPLGATDGAHPQASIAERAEAAAAAAAEEGAAAGAAAAAAASGGGQRQWYGSAGVLEQWVHLLLQPTLATEQR